MSKSKTGAIAGAGMALVLSVSGAAAAPDVEHGKQVFQACAACHSDKPDSLGPNLIGLIGRKAGMTQVFQPDGTMVAVSVLEVAPNTVTALRTDARDGYTAIALGTVLSEIRDRNDRQSRKFLQ